MSRHGGAARDKVMAIAMKRKEEYLGARVPRELKEKVIDRARDLGIPVSILIRNVLEDAFGAAHGGVRYSTQQADKNEVSVAKGAPVRFPAVLGWEDITLNRNIDCSACGRPLKSGMSATLGVATPGENHVILCDLCKDTI
jgi:hypothetical protein